MKTSYLTAVTLATACFTSGVLAAGSPLTLGAGALYVQSPYQGGKERYYPFPLINYEDANFFVSGLQGGYFLWKDQQDQFSLIITSSGQEYDPKRTSSSAMKQLDKRHLTLMAGGQWQHIADWGVLKTSLVGDVLDQSNGFVWNTNWHYPLMLDGISLNPGAGVSWNSSKQTNYYYGVSSAESRHSGISSYDAGDSWLPYVEVSASYPLTSRWQLGVGGRYQWFGSEVKDSPMVAKSGQAMIWTGLSYTF